MTLLVFKSSVSGIDNVSKNLYFDDECKSSSGNDGLYVLCFLLF